MSAPLRFVHAADLHLGAPFKGVDASDARVRDALVASTHEALARIVDLCLTQSVDFLVIAGDVYNAADKSVHDQAFFRSQMRRLAEAGIRAYVAHGNHDPADGWSAGLALPETVHLFSHEAVERVEHVRDGEVVAALYGRSFPTKKVTARYASHYRRQGGDPFAVGVLHTNVGGRPGYEDYAPCSSDDLAGGGMDYWALGHIHLPARVLDTPRAVYAGCPQGLTPNEDGPRGCYLVEAGPHGVEERFVETSSVRWARRSIDVSEVADIDSLLATLSSECRGLAEESEGRPVIARFALTGRSPLHAGLARPLVMDDIMRELRAEQLDRDGWVWVDELRDDTGRPVDAEASRDRDGFDGVLVRLCDEKPSEDVARELDELLDAVVGRLVVRPEVDLDAPEVLARARDLCLDLLSPEADR